MGERVHETPIDDFERSSCAQPPPDLPVSRRALPAMLAAAARVDRVRLRARRRSQPFSGAAGYITSKAAVLAFVDVLDAEYRDDGIRGERDHAVRDRHAGQPRIACPTPITTAGSARRDRARHRVPLLGRRERRPAAPHIPVYGRADLSRDHHSLRPPLVDARRRLRRDVHAAARHHDRERRAAGHREGPGLVVLRSAVGRRRLRAVARRAAADRRVARRPPRPPPGLRRSASRSSRPPRCSAALATSPLFLDLARGAAGHRRRRRCSRRRWRCSRQAFHGRERGTAFGAWGATTGAAVAVGPLVGGVLTEAFGWESIFFVNVPIGIAAIAADALRASTSRATRTPAGVDWAGLVTFSGGLFLLVFALVRGNAEGWGSPLIVAFLVGAVVLLVAFVRRRAPPVAPDVRPLAVPQAGLRRRVDRRVRACRRRCSRCSST